MAPRLSKAVAVALEISEDDWKRERGGTQDVVHCASYLVLNTHKTRSKKLSHVENLM